MKKTSINEMRKVNGGKTYVAKESCPFCDYVAEAKISYWVDFMGLFKNTAKAHAHKKLLDHIANGCTLWN